MITEVMISIKAKLELELPRLLAPDLPSNASRRLFRPFIPRIEQRSCRP